MRTSHRDRVPFEIPGEDVPSALVNHEWRLVGHLSISIGFCNNPRGHVGSTKIEDFALNNNVVESVHDFFDGTGVVPPVNIEDVDIVRS